MNSTIIPHLRHLSRKTFPNLPATKHVYNDTLRYKYVAARPHTGPGGSFYESLEKTDEAPFLDQQATSQIPLDRCLSLTGRDRQVRI